MSKSLAVGSNILDHTTNISDRQAPAAFGERIRTRAEEINLTMAKIGELAGIKKQSMSGYWNGDRLCGSDKLFALSDILRVNARWLISGEGPKTGGDLVSVEDADWEQLPFYDLRDVTDTGMGEAKDYTRVRKDWLNRTFGRSKGLWLTNLPTEYPPLDFREGEQVICCDTPREELRERYLCLWRMVIANQIIVGRYSVVPKHNQISVQDEGEYWINPHLVQGDDKEIVPIGRILGRFLQRI